MFCKQFCRLLSFAMLGLAACQRVPPAPIDATSNAERLATRALNDPDVITALARYGLEPAAGSGWSLDALTVVSKFSLFCTACDGEGKLAILITPDGFGGFTLQANLSGGNVHSTTNLSGNRNRIFDRVASLIVTPKPSEPGAFFQFRPGAVVV